MSKIAKYKIEIAVFLCGAIGMALELVAARVLSPYVGSSNLIWTTIIGIMLISMSLGYLLGGKLADKKADINIMSILILIGAVFVSVISIEETVLVKGLSMLTNNLILVAILTSLIIFGIPSFIVAAVSPYAVKLKDKDHDNIGKLSGKISSLSTIGSIIGTFLTGFVLIPTFGVRTIIMFLAIILFVLAFVLYRNKNKKVFCIFFASFVIIIMLNYLGEKVFNKSSSDIIKDVDSQYSRIWVKSISNEDESKKYKTMQVDTALESYIDDNTGKMGAKYLYYYDLFDYFNKDANSTLMIGGAAYTYPKHYLSKYENKTIDVVEIDEKMTQIAQEEFGLDIQNPRFKNYIQDGRSFLNYTKNKYDVILNDAFKGINAPFELTTYEAMINAKNALNENGMVITNVISALQGEDAKFLEYEYSTYKAVFDDVKLFKVHKDADENIKQNLILVGIKGRLNINESKTEEYKEFLENEIKDYKSEKPIVTDNYSPIGN